MVDFSARQHGDGMKSPAAEGLGRAPVSYTHLFPAGRVGDAAGPLRNHYFGDDDCWQHGIQENRSAGPGHHGDGLSLIHISESHGREDTMRLIGRLPRRPMKKMVYRGVEMEEFDLGRHCA